VYTDSVEATWDSHAVMIEGAVDQTSMSCTYSRHFLTCYQLVDDSTSMHILPATKATHTCTTDVLIHV